MNFHNVVSLSKSKFLALSAGAQEEIFDATLGPCVAKTMSKYLQLRRANETEYNNLYVREFVIRELKPASRVDALVDYVTTRILELKALIFINDLEDLVYSVSYDGDEYSLLTEAGELA